MQQGIYESLITKLVQTKLDDLDQNEFFIGKKVIDKTEAKDVLSQYFSIILKRALSFIIGEDPIPKQIELINKLILLIREELQDEDFEHDLLELNSHFLTAVFSKIDFGFSDFNSFLIQITPESRLIFSSLFTGGGGPKKLQMDGELQKEINSSNRIDFLVSFIKWEGLRLLMQELEEFSKRGGKLRLITTTYVGATDAKCVEYLSNLPNAEVKVSYNTQNERVHVKAYLFHRNTGFDTAYIGSSNISKSALTKGLEWNVKLTSREIPHVLDTAQNAFETYWNSKDFETYKHVEHSQKLKNALKQGKFGGDSSPFLMSFFDIKPYTFQEEILEKLEVERNVHHRFKNLVVAATGTGKTVIAAFDFKKFLKTNPNAKLLFVAHRKEILQQTRATFQAILKDNNFGELWVGGIKPSQNHQLFASIQTLNIQLESLSLSPSFFDFIIIDEVHHIEASSYRPILKKFQPKILLGLTATPERMDGADILADFDDHIAAEIRLPEALNQKLLSPFNYFGITDNVDISQVTWSRGRYIPSELSLVYTRNDIRVAHILKNLEKYLRDINDVRALGFCVTQEHAQYMAEKFTLANLKADFLVSGVSSERRESLRKSLINKEINFLFVVDIFNEGVDIPEIDTVLFLRPTESLTVFLQQLGRGLRLADGKDCLTVLDFVGNARTEYDFEGKFRSLIGKTNTSIQQELEHNFQHVPLGCSIILEKQAKETILRNIKAAINPNRAQLIQRIRNFKHQSELPLTLKNFIKLYHYPFETIYHRGAWNRLCFEAEVISEFDPRNETEWVSCVRRKWLSTESYSYFSFILSMAKAGFQIDLNSLSENEKTMCLMLHYDFWQNAGGFKSLEESIQAIGKNSLIISEMIEVLELRMDQIGFMELEIDLPFKQPLKVHSRYTRDQILAGFGFSTFKSKSSNREGVAENSELNIEILFINLNKSIEHYSPTTMYLDYAISEMEFHWATQNSARPDRGKGLSYIKHQENGKRILLFVREENENEYGNKLGYVFIGEGNLKSHYGSKPMSINWELNDPIPPFLYQASAKLSAG